MNGLLVVPGAMVGAPLRSLTDRAVQSRHDSVFPWGTFAANVTGCLILGLLTGAVAEGAAGSQLQFLPGTALGRRGRERGGRFRGPFARMAPAQAVRA